MEEALRRGGKAAGGAAKTNDAGAIGERNSHQRIKAGFADR